MCIILHNQKGKRLDKKDVQVAYDNNPHGFGIMWLEDDRINVIKGLCDFKQIWQMLKMFEGLPHCLHLRWRTSGEIIEDHCHPFKVLDKDLHGLDLCVAHNGTIYHWPLVDGKSDTQIFCEKLSKNILTKDPTYQFKFLHKLERFIGTPNKLVLMASDGRTFILNENQGRYIDDIWYSNVYSLEVGYRAKALARSRAITMPGAHASNSWSNIPKIY